MKRSPRTSRGIAAPSIALVLSLACTGAGWAQTAPSLSVIGQATLDASYGAWPSTGVAAGFQLPNGQTWTGAAGYVDLQHSAALSPTDQFRVGSQTKTYTGTLILQMVSQGQLGLDQTVAQILPGLNVNNANQITVRELLNMTSGIPDYLNAPSAHTPGETILQEWNVALGQVTSYTPEQLVQQTNLVQPLSAPGAQMNYSNTNFVILGLIAEKVANCQAAGCTIASLIQSRLLAPLGLNSTVFTTNDQFSAAFARGYLLGVNPATPGSKDFTLTTAVNPAGQPPGTAVDFSHVQPQVPWAAGAIISTPADELKWIEEIATNSAGLLSAAVQALRLAGNPNGTVASFPAQYGLAIYDQPNPLTGTSLLGHGGLITGYNSDIVLDTSSGIAYVANVSGFDDGNAPLAQAPAVVWMLSRNIDTAVGATGTCTSGSNDSMAGGSCTGVSVRTGSLTVSGGTLTIAPSGQTYAAYQPTLDGRGEVAAPTPVPSIAFYGDGMAGLTIGGNAAAVIQSGALVTMTGLDSTAVSLPDQGSSLTIGGGISTATVFAVQIGVASDGTSLLLPMVAPPGTLALSIGGHDNTVTLTPTGVIAGDVAVGGSGNTLRGAGTIDGALATTRGNTVAPGVDGAGVLTVSAYQGNGGTLRIAIDPAGNASALSVIGPAVLNNDRLSIVGSSGAPDTIQAVLLATGGISGSFAMIDAGSGPAFSVAQGNLATLVATVSPGPMDAASQIAWQQMQDLRDAIATRLGALSGDPAPGQTQAPLAHGHATAWISGIGGIGNAATRQDGVEVHTSESGIALGMDGFVAPGVVLGLSYSHLTAHASLNGFGGQATSASDMGSIYGGWLHGRLLMVANFIGGHGDDSSSRIVNDLGLLSAQSGRFGDTRLGGGVTVGLSLPLHGFHLTPRLGLSYDTMRFTGFAESGAAPLRYGSHVLAVLRGEAVLTGARSWRLARGVLSVDAHAGVAHDWLPGKGSVTATLSGFPALALDARPRAGTLALAGAGAQYQAMPKTLLFVAYDGTFGGPGVSNLFRGGVRIAF